MNFNYPDFLAPVAERQGRGSFSAQPNLGFGQNRHGLFDQNGLERALSGQQPFPGVHSEYTSLYDQNVPNNQHNNNQNAAQNSQIQGQNSHGLGHPATMGHASNAYAPNLSGHPFQQSEYDHLYSRLAQLDGSQRGLLPTSRPSEPPFGLSPQLAPLLAPQLAPLHDTFNLPVELQGGIGTISSRRPSYAAESFTRSDPPMAVPGGGFHTKNSLATFAAANNYNNHRFNLDMLNDSFSGFNLNSNYSDFQQRRPSQLVDFQTPLLQSPPANLNPPELNLNAPNVASAGNSVSLENGLLLKDKHILASPELRLVYSRAAVYFHNPDTTASIVAQIDTLLTKPPVARMVAFIKNLNNLTFNHKLLCLVVNKNGKFDLLSYPTSSNVSLQKGDLVVVDGDRGKDLVLVLEPLVSLNFAILFNFLKKLEHLKSLTIYDSHHKQMSSKKNCGGTHSTALDASTIINSPSNEDNEFLITLPTKQVLRLATPKEVHKLSNKFVEEKLAYITCYNKIKELNLHHDLQLINVEYQFDFKKLIFYYFAGFKRIDFRGLIKELFKIYKTRIWLCAVLPYDKPNTYITLADGRSAVPAVAKVVNLIPREYEAAPDRAAAFSLEDMERLSPEYFHLKNLTNLIQHVNNELGGNFYGFNRLENRARDDNRQKHVLGLSFNPFGDGVLR